MQGLPDTPMQISITDDCSKSPELDIHSQISSTHIHIYAVCVHDYSSYSMVELIVRIDV